jgi:hypothetical protein
VTDPNRVLDGHRVVARADGSLLVRGRWPALGCCILSGMLLFWNGLSVLAIAAQFGFPMGVTMRTPIGGGPSTVERNLPVEALWVDTAPAGGLAPPGQLQRRTMAKAGGSDRVLMACPCSSCDEAAHLELSLALAAAVGCPLEPGQDRRRTGA